MAYQFSGFRDVYPKVMGDDVYRVWGVWCGDKYPKVMGDFIE